MSQYCILPLFLPPYFLWLAVKPRPHTRKANALPLSWTPRPKFLFWVVRSVIQSGTVCPHVVPATWEAEARGCWSEYHLGNCKDLSWKGRGEKEGRRGEGFCLMSSDMTFRTSIFPLSLRGEALRRSSCTHKPLHFIFFLLRIQPALAQTWQVSTTEPCPRLFSCVWQSLIVFPRLAPNS